ncbi:ABC transporter ATP-binding protein [soil metagenome]
MPTTLLKASPTPHPPAGGPALDAAVEIDHLSKRYGSTVALDDVSLRVGRGEIFGILGPNGAGKTTLVECAQGLRRTDEGHIRLLGLDLDEHRGAVRRRVGSQLQESALPDQIKVWEALDLFSSLSPGGSDWRPLLEQWGLADKAKARFSSLSGGQRQRLFVALALVNDPEVVFLDEMTQGLDPSARRVAWDLIRTMRERGTTVVLVTHYMDEAEQLCDRLAVVAGGHIVALGTPQELIDRSGQASLVRFSTDRADLSWLETVDGVSGVSRSGREVEVAGAGPVLALVAAELVAHSVVPADLRVVQATLEDVYLELTEAPRPEESRP